MKYKLFFTPMCPNCPSVKEFMKKISIIGEEVDASTEKGLEEAIKLNISSVPTVVFFEDDKVKSVAHSIEEIKRIVQNKTLV